jgi:hypothetical protein
MKPTAAPNIWPYPNHRTVEQVDREEKVDRVRLARLARLTAYQRLKAREVA